MTALLPGTGAAARALVPASPFAGIDICREAGLSLPPGAARPVFEDDEWDFTHVIGLPVRLNLGKRRFDFTLIPDQRWRLVAKELIAAMLAPQHEAVATLSRAYRTPVHIATARNRLDELTRLLNWLPQQGILSLDEVHDDCCAAWLAHRSHARDEAGTVISANGPPTRRAAAQIVIDLVSYRELFTADQPRQDLRPWRGAPASVVAGMPTRWENKTAPVPGHVLQPLLASALYVVTMLGPVAVEVAAELRKTALDGSRKPERPGEHAPQKDPLTRFPPVLAQHRQDRAPFGEAAATADVLASFGRRALTVTAVGGEALPWTIPLHRAEAEKLIGIVRTAVIIVILAVTGMRSSEVMELQVGARQPPKEAGTGMARYRIASNVIKGQPLGGTWDEWVVIEPVYQAVGLAERLHDDPRDGALLFGRFGSRSRYQVFRDWVNGPAGQRLGLAPIPGGLVTPRMLRRTLAIELAYRPGGLLAAKLHLKHISVATTEGRYPALAALRPSS